MQEAHRAVRSASQQQAPKQRMLPQRLCQWRRPAGETAAATTAEAVTRHLRKCILAFSVSSKLLQTPLFVTRHAAQPPKERRPSPP
ncbi:hypothetical protein cyc_06448 [Cyclospora cayetanensis]|uniref:Uncharacterized protein n=1 Tax=Cyclospora cayetanensis TaxID=88456 RepID=A0A1D3CRK8_9EIME|nr:hypothetical protein cyc_06448 [Cyclospora cayetanensis]